MKYLIFFIILMIGLLIISCEPETETVFYEYLTLINCDGSEKVHLNEDRTGRVHFCDNNQKIIYTKQDDFILLDLNTLQSEIIFPPESDIWSMNGYELFHEFQKIIYWEATTDWDILVATIETGEIENLTNTLDIREGKVKLSPSEEYIAYIERDYTHTDSVFWSIKYQNFDGSIENTVYSKLQGYGPGEFRYVDWINESKLLYCDNDAGINPGIYSINLDGTDMQQIFSGLYLEFSLSQDRTKAVFDHEDEIYFIDTSELSVSHLAAGSESLISPDGNKIAYINEDNYLVIQNLEDNSITLLSETPTTTAVGFSNDSRKLIFNELIEIIYRSGKRIL